MNCYTNICYEIVHIAPFGINVEALAALINTASVNPQYFKTLQKEYYNYIGLSMRDETLSRRGKIAIPA